MRRRKEKIRKEETEERKIATEKEIKIQKKKLRYSRIMNR